MTLSEEVINLYYAEVTDESDEEVEMTVTRIAHETGLTINKVRKIIFGEDETGTATDCPYYLKKYHGDYIPTKKYQEIKGQIFLRTEATALALVQRSLKYHMSNPDPLTISETKDIMGMVTQLDKINRLEDGKPTEIIKSTNYTPQRIIQIIEADPMYGGKKRKYGKEENESEEENNPRRIEGRDGSEGSDGRG